MRSLIQKFYSGSPFKRIMTVAGWLLIISVASTVYSFINLASQMKSLNESGVFKEIGFENIPAQRGGIFIDEPLKNALAGWKVISEMSQKMLIVSMRGEPFQIAEEVSQHDQEIITAVRSFGSLDWKYLLLFASPQLDPLSDELAENFKKIRTVSRFLYAFHRRFKQMHPDENSSFIFAAQVKLARLNDLTGPFLIGKMITVAVDGIALISLTGLVNEGLLTDAEAVDCIESLSNSLALDVPVKAAMENEFIFFKHSYGRLFSKAPLAMWILEKYYGDPFEQYQKISREMFDNPEYKLEINLVSHNPVLVVAFPNFRKANLQYLEKTSQKAIMLATLMHRLGREVNVLDPWSRQQLKLVQQNDKPVFYSVGPNKVDDNASGDDILLPADPKI